MSATPLLRRVESAGEVERAAAELLEGWPVALDPVALLDECEAWSAALLASAAREVPGVVFLSMWLRRNHLRSLLERELPGYLEGERWSVAGKTSVGRALHRKIQIQRLSGRLLKYLPEKVLQRKSQRCIYRW